MRIFIIFLAFSVGAFGQFAQRVRFVATNPTGACGPSFITQNTTTGVLTGCVGSAWVTIGSGSGSGDMLGANNLSDVASAATARTNLGLAINTNVQAFDATLTSIALLGTAADRIAYTTGVDTWAETPLTAFGRSLIDDAAASNARTTLGLVINTDVAGIGGTNVFTGRQDSSGAASTAPMKVGTSLPGTCVIGDTFFKSDATAGQNQYNCTATNTWTQNLNSGSAGAPADATYITQTANGTLSAEQALGALATGCLGSTTTTGVVNSRTLTGTANEITVTNGDCSGVPTFSLPAVVDLGGKTSLEIPNAAAPTVNVFGQIAGDNNLWAASRGAPVFYDGTAAVALVGALVSDTPTNGQVPTWNTGGTITWETPSATSGISSIDTATGAILLGAGLSRSGQTILFDSTVLSGVYAAIAGPNVFTPGGKNTFQASATTAGLRIVGTAAPSSLTAGDVWIDLSGNLSWTPDGVATSVAGGAPVGATYITQTANGTLTNEQALSSLSTGLMKVTTTTGAITSVVPGTGVETWVVTPSSANLAAAVTGETGSGALVFGTAPTINGLTFPTAGGGAVVAQTIASGAKALATGAIASAACTTAQTDTATGTATTDSVTASFNGDPTAVTGYIPLTAGMLTIIAYPTANTVNFRVCNNTSSSVTPGAITLNWRVTR